ncbi:MAG TPA: biotin transporter BioY [Blastocatellia bacterium]|jgi:biotin transport system substrate-specific component|nr:biotin transporter BioY [Blastocatellia bacterium]HAF23663.1 biotin transporter BioY [Blastocatellia bacterium]HCX30995.1 biotin transporter BioY [Blastocatellia bacterium]
MNSTANSYAQSYAPPDTLLSAALAPLDWTRSVSLVVAFSLLTALAAQVVIPVGPVPITGQTFAVLLTGALLGSRLGAMAMIVYLIEGASGLPFFYGGLSGLAHLLGPTGGYLVAFPAAAFVTGTFAENGWDKSFFGAIVAMGVGSAIIILAGWAWLSQFMGLTVAFHAGVKPFIIGDIVKIVLAAAVLPTGWALLRRKASH